MKEYHNIFILNLNIGLILIFRAMITYYFLDRSSMLWPLRQMNSYSEIAKTKIPFCFHLVSRADRGQIIMKMEGGGSVLLFWSNNWKNELYSAFETFYLGIIFNCILAGSSKNYSAANSQLFTRNRRKHNFSAQKVFVKFQKLFISK